MRRIALFTMFPEWPLARQTLGGTLCWGEAEFALNPEGGRFDAVVVFDGLLEAARLDCPPDRSFFIAGEPPSIKLYHPAFLAQFAMIITCHSDTPHPQVRHLQQGYPWHFGVKQRAGQPVATIDLDGLRRASIPAKPKLLSVIVSDKAVTVGHHHRRAFVTRLRQRFGEEVEIYGRGIFPLPDKADGISPFKYHVALENSAFRDYWTEKLADAFLGFAHPFYWGCPNIADYFPDGAVTPINIYDPEGAIATIERAIAEQRYEASLRQVAEARDLVLNKYNLFAALAALTSLSSTVAPAPLLLHPEGVFRDSMTKKLRQRLRRAMPRRFRRKERPLG
jgi:hypothetical protein